MWRSLSFHRITEGPCEGVVRRQPSAIQGEGPHQTLTLMTSWSWTLVFRTVKKQISIVDATQLMVYCYGSPSQLRHPLTTFLILLDSIFHVLGHALGPWTCHSLTPGTSCPPSASTMPPTPLGLGPAITCPGSFSWPCRLGYVVLSDDACSVAPLNSCVKLEYKDLLSVAHQSRNYLLLCPYE